MAIYYLTHNRMIPQDQAYQIALGNINIYTKEKFACFDPDSYVVSMTPHPVFLL